ACWHVVEYARDRQAAPRLRRTLGRIRDRDRLRSVALRCKDSMARSKVAILRTTPATVLADYHRLLNLAGYQDVIAKDADTALKVNISWHFFYPGSSPVPGQAEG